MKISKIAINHPAPMYLLLVMIAVLGSFSYSNMPREANPDIQIPILIVAVPFPGASPEDSESLITHKLEKEFAGLESLKKMTSTSTEGVATVVLEFTPDFDLDEARTEVRDALDKVEPEFPEDAEDAVIEEINLSEEPLLLINLSGEVGLERLKDIAEDLKDRIEAIPGILEVKRAGGLEREIRVYVNPEKLQYYRLDLNQVSQAIEAENTTLPGGSIDVGPTKFLIRVPGEFETPQEIENALVAAPGQVPVLVKDIGTVVFGFQELTSRSRLNGLESISLSVVKRSGENLFAIRNEIKQIIDDEAIKQDGLVSYKILSDQSKFVTQLSSDLENNLITGFALVVFVLMVVMGIRNSMFVAAAIPVSFLMAVVFLDGMGFTLNMMVLYSLILALGMLVDNAVVVVENIYRHIQAGKPRKVAAKEGIMEVSVPITTSTLTTLAAFTPLLFMPGIIGEFMSFIPKTLIVALACSLFVGLLINPMLCATLMKVPRNISYESDELKLMENSRVLLIYKGFLSTCIRFRWLVLLLTISVYMGVMVVYQNTTFKKHGVEFFPETEPNEAVVNIRAPIGTRLEVSNDYTEVVEEVTNPYWDSVSAVVANVGQGRDTSESGSTTFLSHVVIEFPDWHDWKIRPSEIITGIREGIGDIAGAEIRVSKQQNGPPTGPPVNIEIKGEDFAIMEAIADDIKLRIKDQPGLVDLRDDFDQSRPEVRVVIDREKAGRLGLRAQDIALTVRIAFNGRKVSEFREGTDEYDIVVQLDEEFRQNVENLSTLYIATPSQELVALSEVARIETGPAYGSIRHVKQDRVITVSANAEGVPGPVLLEQVRELLVDLELPNGYEISFTGENEDREESQGFLIQSFFIAIFLIFIILTAQFNSFAMPIVILSSVILSLMGVIIGLMIHGRPFSIIMGGIGTVSLAGIVVNNAIVLIDFIQQLRKRGYARDEAVVLAGMVRLRPVLLTTVTTILGLLPSAMGIDINFFRPFDQWFLMGAESGTFWIPMALAIIYGLAVATVLTLVVVPVIYSIIEGTKAFLAQLLFRKRKPPSKPSQPTEPSTGSFSGTSGSSNPPSDLGSPSPPETPPPSGPPVPSNPTPAGGVA